MSVKTSADWFEYALAGNAASIKNAKKKWKGTKDSDGNTALMLVSKLEGNSVFDLLIHEEAGNMNNEGHSALSIAVLARQIDKVKRLATLEGSMVLGRGCTALIYAASVRDADVVPLLAPYSILDQRNDEGYSALDIAVMNNDLAFTTSLLDAARVDLETLDMAIRYSLTPDSIKINQILTDYRAATYPNADSFDPDAKPGSYQAPSTASTGLNHQGTIDPRSTDFASSESPAQSRNEKQKSGKRSRSGSKQASVRKASKLDNASFSNSTLVQSVARIETPASEEIQSIYGQVTNSRSFDPTEQSAFRPTNAGMGLQNTIGPGYASSNFGDMVRSTSLVDDPLPASTDLKSPKNSKLSRTAKQTPVRNTSFSNSALVQSVPRMGTPAPEEVALSYGRAPTGNSACYGETYAMSMEAPANERTDSGLQYSTTPSGILTTVGYSHSGEQPSTNSAVLSRLRTPTSSVVMDKNGNQGADLASTRALQGAGSFGPAAYSNATFSTRSLTESMPAQSRRTLQESASVAQLQELVREKQAIIDDLQNQNTKMNKEVIDLKRNLHKAELVSGSGSQGHWATQSSIDRTNLVITDMQEQAREMKTEAIRAKNFFERERERLNEVISEKEKRIAILENTNRNLETSSERLRAANKDLIEQLTKKKTDDGITEMLVAQKDAEIGELRDRIKELENDVVRLTNKASSHPSTAVRSRSGEETTVSQLTGDSNPRGYPAQTSNSTQLSAGPDDAGVSEASLQDVVKQLTSMNNSKDIIISELRGELANLRDINKHSQRASEVSRSRTDDLEVHDVKMALADLQARHDALSEDNSKTIEKLRVRTRELQGLVEEMENEIPAGNAGTLVDVSRMKAIVKIKNREIAELKENALNTASRHAATCKAINAENERLNAAIRRKENELTKIRSELSTARDFQDHVEGVRSENTQLVKEMKRMQGEIDKHANIHPELAKYESLVKTLGNENDTMRRVLKKRKEQIEYLKNGGDPSLLHTIGADSKLSGTNTLAGKSQVLNTDTHTDIINRDAQGNDVALVKKLTEEVGAYDTKVTELSRMIALKDAEISLLRKQTTDGATYKDLLCLLNEKMKRVDQLHSDIEQRDREISKLVTINRTGTAKPKGLTASLYKNSAMTRFYSHEEVKDLLKQLSDKETEITLLKSENMNNSYEKIHNIGDKFNVVKIENLEDKVAVLNAHLADREGTIERLQAQLQDAELALQSHRANLGLIGAGGLMGSGSYASHRERASASPSTVMSPDLAYSKSLEASNASLQQKLADSKLKMADAQQELDWAQMRINSMHDDLQRYKSMSGAANTPTAEGGPVQQHSVNTPLSITGQRPVLEPKNHTPTYSRGK